MFATVMDHRNIVKLEARKSLFTMFRRVSVILNVSEAQKTGRCVWVSPHTVTDMLTLLPNVRPLFLTIQELRVERYRWIVGLTLQTNNQEDD